MSRLRILGRRRDAGAVATIVAILLAGGVLLGMTALVVDIGQLYAEREELQSGADAAAMAVALDCAQRGDVTRGNECLAAASTVPGYADRNARDGDSAIVRVCGSDSRLTPCSTVPGGNLADCIGTVPSGATYVEVRTKTETNGGSYIYPASFAQTLVDGYSGTTVGACSRVGWGSPGVGVALTFCLTEWNDATGSGTDLAPPPPAVPAGSYEVVLRTRSPGGGKPGGSPADPCEKKKSGADLPGDFGWTDTPDAATCQTLISSAGMYGVDPGSDVVKSCEAVFVAARDDRTPVIVPIYNEATGTGSGGVYRLEGFAAFVITGWGNLFPGVKDVPSWLNPATKCSPGDVCIFGYFTNALLPWSGGFSSTTNYGATVIKTIG
ncbi:hypothetical protein CS0771_13600 [Catellatospora sp. IY07-71]|uniref:pilus assembly protein TadG-related protein n=1 Tax=Catellatospora sp. IY07-71 TaxID=2728827 RepID=UPI001BB38F9F|nr:pilus assembly protein TadG-related protein [Catellatospora sp. IY07-71]BCJ71816.1 hypothetical protein CS0771_13600 [Catellatospora sp. IY07-71]